MAKRQFVSFPFPDLSIIKQQVLSWSVRFNTCSFLDNQSYPSEDPGYECLAAVGEIRRMKTVAGDAFQQLRQFSMDAGDWLFGHFSFDLKAETEQSPSRLPDDIGFPDLFFFIPETVILLFDNRIEIGIHGHDHERIWHEIQHLQVEDEPPIRKPADIQKRITRDDYLNVIHQLRQHILRGDCYEINFCQEFFVEDADVDPVTLYRELTTASPSPFSGFYKTDERFLICASPERYLKRKKDRIYSQPMKGTAARDTINAQRDQALKSALAVSEKDRAENVMIVDLVRNDLSKICETDTVHVSELFGVYSFPQVHQMISTIEGRPRQDLYWTDMIALTFPMGSMTGAPKKRVLELIEQYEVSRRGLFSGALGYVNPEQDFDFNVVIRSMLYNRTTRHLAYFAGSGITINSDPELEYEECLLKVAAFEKIIKKPTPL